MGWRHNQREEGIKIESYNIALVEDTPGDLVRIQTCLDRFSEENGIEFRIFSFSRGEDLLEDYRPIYDIVFMDIMLPGINGMETAEQLRHHDKKVLLFFLTNMSDYAIKGYTVGAMDYVMKPVTYYSLAMRLNSALRRIDTERDVSVVLRMQDGVRVLSDREIYYIEIRDHDVMFHTVDGDLKAYGTLSEREKELEGHGFVRCSSWALVNLRYVEQIYKDEVVVAGQTVHISRARRKNFLNAFNTYLGRQ